MGKKTKKQKLAAENTLLSTPVKCGDEFEGLVSFEELSSCTFMSMTKQGKIKREIWKDGKIIKKKDKKKAKQKSDELKTNQIATSKPKKEGKKAAVTNGVEKEELKPSDHPNKKRKKKKNSDKPAPSKKARYDNATFHGSNQEAKENVDMSAWDSLFVPEEVLKALSELGFSNPTEIQRLVLPAAIKGRMDIIGAAETGSGKTLAFGIPIIHGILHDIAHESEHPESEGSLENDSEDGDFADEEDGDVEDGIEEVDGDLAELENGDSEESDDEGDEFAHENFEDAIDIGGEIPGDESDDDAGSGSDVESEFNEEDMDQNLGCVKVIDNVKFDFLKDDESKPNTGQRVGKPLRCLIVTPTRELAVQVKSHLASVLVHTNIKVAVVIGGVASEKQTRILNRRPEIVVGTPGRLWELIEQGNEHLGQIENIKYLAIDETDRMVEQGHFEELKKLLEIINGNEAARLRRQNFVFSATLTLVHKGKRRVKTKGKVTMTSEIKVKQLAKMIGLKDKPKIVDVTRKFGTAESLTESRINCDKEEKDYYLYYILKQYPGRTLVFCNSIDCVRRLQNLFTFLQCQPMSLHASMHQKQRLKSLERFSSSSVALLLATDVAARGLDIPNIQHVIHYQTPRTAETYIHRSGRTARAEQEGLSVLFIDSSEIKKYRQLCLSLNRATDLPPFPVEVNIMEQVKKRVDFARQLELMDHSNRKERAEDNWFKKAARDADILLDSDDDDEDEKTNQAMMAARAKRENKVMKAKLRQMLSRPMVGSGFSGKYPTQTGSLLLPLLREQREDGDEQDGKDALSVMKKEAVEFTKLVKKVKPRPPKKKKVNTRKFKGYEKRRNKLIKEKERREKEEKQRD
ncbi:ATP-dependent RNA helicase DDX24 isoform X2 [Palaemon carinicauda]|uniref:ATP-dependent RNA helicase DDX24 isoform X2 n=1 Tax=Palaemon carinicauda TaxID=392227 RepID=UPI0035B63AA8